jgi:hypothetical protein
MEEIIKKSINIFINLCNDFVDDSDIEYIDIAGCTPLGWASVLGKHNLVEDLLKRGANPNVKVFAFLYQMVKIDWILDPALSAIRVLLSPKLKEILQKDKILLGFKTVKEHGYMNSDGIQIKYIINVFYEVNKYTCFSKGMLQRWKTQEDFNRKLYLCFWFFPKIVDKKNAYIHKFYKTPEFHEKLRLELVKKYSNNPLESYKKISELIPLNKYEVDTYLNDKWTNVIIPDIIKGMIVKIICEDPNTVKYQI